MYQLAPNVELQFTEAGEVPDRVRAAAAAGFDAVEMWGTTGKDLDALKAALSETGVQLTALLAEPRTNFSLPGTSLDAYWAGLELNLRQAQELSCPRVVVGAGIGFPGKPRAPQLDTLVEVFGRSTELAAAAGVTLVLEPVNSRVDHPGVLTDRTEDAVHVAERIGHDNFGVLYDLYHSVVMGEDPVQELAAAGRWVKYVQVADAPGRGEPGSGSIDWDRRLGDLRAAGYDGPIGLEYFPTTETLASLKVVRAAAQKV